MNKAQVYYDRYEEGIRCLEDKNTDEAIILLNKAIFLAPHIPELYLSRAEAYIQYCDFKGALANFRKASRMAEELPTEARKTFAALLDAEGYRFLLKKQYRQSLVYFNESIDQNSLRPNFWRHRILAYIGLDMIVKALKDVDHCICLEGKTSEMLLLRAKLNWKLGLRDRGNEDIADAYKLDPTNMEVANYEKTLWSQSREVYDRACEYLMQRDFSEALYYITAAMQLNPDDVKILVMRASCLREMGDLDSAMHDVSKAAYQYGKLQQGSKEHPEISRQRNLIRNDDAVRHMKEKAYDVAVDLLNLAIESEVITAHRWDAVDSRFYVNRGDCYRELGKLHAAMADYNRALDILPSTDIRTRLSFVHHSFGIELFNRGSFDRAELEFSKAIQYNGKVSKYYVHRAEAAEYQDKNAAAFLDYCVAAKLDPHDVTVQEKMSQYKRMGRLPQSEKKKQKQHCTIQKSAKFYQDRSFKNAEQAKQKYRQKDHEISSLFHDRLRLDQR